MTTINSKKADEIAEPAENHDYGLELCLKTMLIAKPAHQLFADNLIGLKTRVHWLTDATGEVLGSFATFSAAFGWCLDNDVQYLVVHTERGTSLLAIKWLKSTPEHEQWLKLASLSSP